jgi:hypothetical protein
MAIHSIASATIPAHPSTRDPLSTKNAHTMSAAATTRSAQS